MERITGLMPEASLSLSRHPLALPVSHCVSRPVVYERLSSTNPFAAELLAQQCVASPSERRSTGSPAAFSAVWDAVPTSTRVDSGLFGSTNPFAAEMLAAEPMAFVREYRPALSVRSMAEGISERRATLPIPSLMTNEVPPVRSLARPAIPSQESPNYANGGCALVSRCEKLADRTGCSAEFRQGAQVPSSPEKTSTAVGATATAISSLTVREASLLPEVNGNHSGENELYTQDPVVSKSMHDRLDALVEEVAQLRALLSSTTASLARLSEGRNIQERRLAVHYVQNQSSHDSLVGSVHFTGGSWSKRYDTAAMRDAEAPSNNSSRVAYQRESLISTVINGTEVAGLWDTGASISLISASLARRLNMKLNSASVNAAGITGDDLPVTGFVTAKIQIGQLWRRQRLHVVSDASQELVLGTDFLAKLPSVTFDYRRGAIRVGGQVFSFCGLAQHLPKDVRARAAPTVAAVQCKKQRKRSRPKRRKLRGRTDSCADLCDPSVVAYQLEPTTNTVNTNRLGKAFGRPLPARTAAIASSNVPAVRSAQRCSTAEADGEAILMNLINQRVFSNCMPYDDRSMSQLPAYFCTSREPSANVGLALTELTCGRTKTMS